MGLRVGQALLLAVGGLALVACSASSQPSSGVTLPSSSQGYLSDGANSVVFIQLGRQGDQLTGTEDWAEVVGTAPDEGVSTGSTDVSGALTQQGIDLAFGSSAKQFGTVGPGTLVIEVPQHDGTLADITLNIADVSAYNSDLADLRSNVASQNNAATTTTTTYESPSTSPPATSPPVTAAPAPPGSPQVPVVECPTEYGAGTPQAQPNPGSEPVNLPAATAAQLDYYTTDMFSVPPVLGPAGWNCTAGVGADGSVGITIYPSGDVVPRRGTSGQPSVIASSDSACQGCVYDTVCRFVPDAAIQLGYQGTACPSGPAGESTYWVAGSANAVEPIHDVIAFDDPGTPDATNGVVLYDLAPQQGSASEDDCTLPVADHGLCTAILNRFAADAWLMN